MTISSATMGISRGQSLKLAVVATHPVQYNAPWFRLLNGQDGIQVRVFYTWHTSSTAFDKGFEKEITWDIPLLDGYQHELVPPSKSIVNRSFRNMDSPALVSQIELWEPNALLVIGWNYRSHIHAMRYFKQRIPVLFRGDSTMLNVRRGLRSKLRSIWLRHVYRNIDFALVVGKNNRDYFRCHGLEESQLVTVPHAIDNDRFGQSACSEPDEQAARWRTDLGLSDSDNVILFVGKFEPKKAPIQLIKEFRAAANLCPEKQFKLVLVGDGQLKSQIVKLIGTDDRFRVLPFQNQSALPIVYRIGEIVVLRSIRNETWGLVMNEAMASGRPIMASPEVGAARDLLVPGKTGFVYPTESVAQSVRAISALPERESLLAMGKDCQHFIRDWSFEAIVEQVKRLLGQIC